MNLCLGYIAKNEGYFLEKLLPTMADSFGGIVAVVDTNSSDNTVEILKQYNANIMLREWDNNFSNARNALIAEAERLGFEAIIMLDGDEALFPHQIQKIKEALLSNEFIRLPRYEFCLDFDHYDPTIYPDYQGRFFRLNCGFEFRNRVHEMVYKKGDDLSAFQRDLGIILDDCPIYHYGRCKPVEQLWTKYNSYEQLLAKGQIENLTPPSREQLDQGKYWNELKLFTGEHPLKGVSNA